MRRSVSRIESLVWTASPIPPMNYCLAARLSGTVSADAVSQAARSLRRRFPAVFARVIVDDQGQVCEESEGVPDAPLRVREGCEDLDWRRTAEEELGEPFDLYRNPSIRIALLHGTGFSDLVLTVQHARADGLSGVYLLHRLLEGLGGITPLDEKPQVAPNAFDLIPARVKSHPRVLFQKQVVVTGLALMRAASRLKRKPASADEPAADPPPWKRFRVLTAAFDQAQTALLTGACKQHGVTVHGAVCVAWVRALSAQSAGAHKAVRKISSPVNLRERLSAPVGEAFGAYMSTIVHPVHCAPGASFWDNAREAVSQLARATRGERLYMWSLMLETSALSMPPAEFARFTSDFARQPIDYDFSITNLGRLDWPRQFGPLEVQAVYGPAVNTSEQEKTVGVVTFGGQLTLTLTFRDFVVEPAAAAALLEGAVRELTLASQAPP
jgi:NRPS condensation-like uncharacterized protein